MNQTLDPNSKDSPEPKKSEKRKNKSTKTAKNLDDASKNTKEKPSEINPNLLHYTHKLEYQLANTREKIQNEKNKFQHIISGLVNYVEENDGTSQMLKDYLKRLESEAPHEPPPLSNFERLFTTSKYQIIEEPESDKNTTKKSNKIASKEPLDEDAQKPSNGKKTKQKAEATSQPKTKKQKPSKNAAKDESLNLHEEDDVEIIEMPSQTKENPRDVVQPQYQIPALDPLGNLLQNRNAEQLGTLLNQQANPNDLLQSYLMLQAANPSLLAGIQGFDLNQYEKLAQEMMKMGGNPQQFYK